MLNRIKNLFQELDSPDLKSKGRHSFADKELAACALMVEAAMLDGGLDDSERSTIKDLATRKFGLNDDEATALLEVAARAQDGTNQLIHFTRTIKEHFDESERIELIEMLWEVAYADGILHDYEANLLRRVGGLIYVSDRDRGEARKRVLARLGLADDHMK